MEMDTLLWIVCTILYIFIAWRVYVGLESILPQPKQSNVISSIFWPGLIVVCLVMLVVVLILAIGLAFFLAGSFTIDLFRTLFKGKQIEESIPELDKLEEGVD
jgi:hypothetical protein